MLHIPRPSIATRGLALVLSFGAVSAVHPSIARAQTTVSTRGPDDPTFGYAAPGSGPMVTAGQTFQAPNTTDLTLLSFTLPLGFPEASPYTARLFEWNAATSRPGALLFEASGTLAASPDGGLDAQYFTFGVGRTLTFGTHYLFAVSLENAAALTLRGGTAPYAGGDLAIIFGTSDVAGLQTRGLFVEHGTDLSFTARFGAAQVVPEPGSATLLATGLLAVAGVALRRRRKAS